ncbi:MAG: alanine--tRNA ligase, partial [Bacillota bacterium]
MKASDIRRTFLDFFEERGHERVASGPLVPADDPTLLFTNAGMVQFKDIFVGRRSSPYSRAVTAQKCVRAGGKHNDLENVGRTARHQTFFEMLGNFSFGDYFKREAIGYAWELLTGPFGLPPERLWASVYRDDDEAFELWREVAGLPGERIVRLGQKDNFWAMGDTGPCGPCSEIHYDRGPEYRCDAEVCAVGECDCDRWVEVWNLVFMRYERDADGQLTPLERTGIDTGMGLERMAAILQGVPSNFDIDLFAPLMRELESLCGHTYGGTATGTDLAFRVIVDHIRCAVFLVADGVFPANDGRGYVLRRILRRAVRFGRVLGLKDPFLHRLTESVASSSGDAYPEVRKRSEFAAEMIRAEEQRFGETLEEGLQLLEEIVEGISAEGGERIPAEDVFRLYDTFGFPPDLCEDVAGESGLEIDREGFERLMQGQRERARRARREAGLSSDLVGAVAGAADVPATEFAG